MNNLAIYRAIAKIGPQTYRTKVLLIAFLGTHLPLLAVIAVLTLSTSTDWLLIWATIGVALIATLTGTALTLFMLNGLLAPVVATSDALRSYRATREIVPLPSEYTDEVGTLMANAGATLAALETSVQRLETTDRSTGFNNRARLIELLGMSMFRETESALYALRLLNFDRVASSYGRDTSDRLMKVLARKLKEAVGDGALLARVDGITLTLLQPVAGSEAPSVLADRLCATLCEPVRIGENTLRPEVACGIAMLLGDGKAPDEVVDNALAAIPRSGDNVINFHSARQRDDLRESIELEHDLRSALADGQFSLHYQPVVNTRSATVTGVEALLRWRHPERGFVPPGKFIPLAEQIGIIDELGLWVVRDACRQIGEWTLAGLPPLKVAVNVSGRQFANPRFVSMVAAAISEGGVPAGRIEVELTETVIMADKVRTAEVFRQLADIGISIAIDDFGTGYASMSQLRTLPFNRLKIDREFVTEIDHRPESQAIASAMVALGRGLGLDVLAEGSERPEEVAWLSALGCDLFQGYHFSRPLPPQQIAEAIADIQLRLHEQHGAETHPVTAVA